MNGYYLDFTTAFAPIGWLIVSLTAGALGTLLVQRARRAVDLGAPELDLRHGTQTDRLAA